MGRSLSQLFADTGVAPSPDPGPRGVWLRGYDPDFVPECTGEEVEHTTGYSSGGEWKERTYTAWKGNPAGKKARKKAAIRKNMRRRRSA